MTATTQFDGSLGSEVCDAVIGFDFGTSCSKVVIRTPFHNAGRAFAIPFVAGHDSCKYLLPSVLWLAGDRTSLAPVNSGNLLRDIKFHLMKPDKVPVINGNEPALSYDAKMVAVAFLASALRAAREWFLGQKRDLYGKYTLRWTFNLGLPSADFSDEPLCDTYRDVAHAAWCLSIIHAEVKLPVAEEVLSSPETWDAQSDIDSAEINIVPEVAAEVAGYARSHLRDEGLHMLVDVGATTLDVCGFILHETDGDDCYELLTADTPQLGASILYHRRVSGVREAVNAHMGDLWNQYDPVSPMSDDLNAYAPCHEAIARSIEEYNRTYNKECVQRVWKTIVDLKTKRDPRSSRWRTEMPLFVSGGGSAMAFYRKLVSKLSKQLSGFYHGCSGIRAMSLVKPDNLEAKVDERTYHRLAVAWGLSYPELTSATLLVPAKLGTSNRAKSTIGKLALSARTWCNACQRLRLLVRDRGLRVASAIRDSCSLPLA